MIQIVHSQVDVTIQSRSFRILILVDIQIATLDREDLDHLTKSTRVLINTVGPYHLYSSPVVESCARNGTHYLDVTGESPWVLQMIEKYHSMARANGAIIIPEIGLESAPSDMIAWSMADLIRRTFSVGTREVICTLHQLKITPSGGTLATILSILDSYSLKEIAKATCPWSMSPIPGPRPQPITSLSSKLFGVRWVPNLGILTTAIAGSANRAIVQRSWGLLDDGNFYGSNFQYHEYMTVKNTLIGVLVHWAFTLAPIALWFRPFRWLAKKLVYAPGEGAAKEATNREAIEYRAVATADGGKESQKKAYARFRYDGGQYYLTGLLLAEAAMVILQDSDIVQRFGGGLLTPAILGQSFIDRLQNAGIQFETGLLQQ